MPLPQEGRVRAPELAGARGWLNTDKPLSLAALRGKVVLLDFWTYGCINCIHIIPDLKRLEQKYSKELVVIGVHSAKFENEKETENLRRIILRYEIEHPVVNDADFRIWQEYGVRGWPTLVLIDPAGYVIGSVSGEGNYDVLDRVIGQTVEEFKKRGLLNEQPLGLALERAKTGDLPLAFPGKVLADRGQDRLFIADSNHNRIVVTRLDGTLLYTIGTGARGSRDGAFESAEFYRPQGMALDGDTLYVADTENHLIRRVQLKSRVVETIAGTGKQSFSFDEAGAAREVSLNSPWDLYLQGRTLYIAMAGPHQIWSLDLDKMSVAVFAGSGREARTDGPLAEAAFAQPSGITGEAARLYVADSEANIIRAIDTSKRSVETLAGGDLFDFGDEDGARDEVRLQHPLGVLAREGKVFIADTYNHKIKLLDPKTGTVKTFSGTGRPGQMDGTRASFYEPGGLSAANGKLFVADTNNHAIRVIDIATRQTSTLRIKGLQPPSAIEKTDGASGATVLSAEEMKTAVQRLSIGAGGTLVVDVALPAGYHLNEAAPQRYRVSVEGGKDVLALAGDSPLLVSLGGKDLQLPLRTPLRALSAGRAELSIKLTLYYCREDDTGTCQIKTLAWRIPVEVTKDANAPRQIKAQGKVE
ncbi:MAG: redoxin domain-containing protein [Pyrinomonadaceae bacterium]|nr:redoxin domain-containing protein [Pyrinomonadaceae bacterium]